MTGTSLREIHAQLVAMLVLTSGDDFMSRRDELRALHLDRILLAAPNVENTLITALIGFCRAQHVKLSVVPPARGQLGAGVQLVHVAELPVLEYNTSDVSRSTILLKRLLDVFLASVLLVLLLPLAAIVALAILLEDGRPVLFSQTRAGIGGRPFTMWKFRTMVRDAEAMLADLVRFDTLEEPVFKLRRDPRVTRVGRTIRRFSIDELPQIVNVLGGDMSLVGPRPEQADLVDRYLPEHRVRLRVKPGLTGPMQVYGRGELSLEERIAVERDYIENLSLGRDLRILAMTVAPVLTGRGAF
jgi:exopolysaccharide biosynthesis polyprenyl glycosylphosphotransferase